MQQLTSRRDFANIINERNYKIVVEVGVGNGGFSRYLLESCSGITLFSIDPWEGVDSRPGGKQKTYEKLAKYDTRSKILDLKSVEGSQQFEDLSIDFVYIDSDHSFDAVKQDLACWWPKIKLSGIMAGHDYDLRQSGVIKAVDNWTIEHHQEMGQNRNKRY